MVVELNLRNKLIYNQKTVKGFCFMKKRILSLVLALAMLISVLPTVSLAGATAVEQEFTITTAGQTADCGWEVVSSRGYNVTGKLYDNGFGQTFRVPWFNNVAEWRAYHVMFRLNVKAAGTYKLQVKGLAGTPDNETFNMGVFWVKDDGVAVEESSSSATDSTTHSAFDIVGGADRSNNATLVGSCDFDDAKPDYQDVATVTVDEAGSYLIAFFGKSDTTATNTASSSAPQILVSGIKLVPESGGESGGGEDPEEPGEPEEPGNENTAVEQELESVEPKYYATSAQGGTYSYDSSSNVLSVTGMQTRRYATAGNHAPFAVIPFTAKASGSYNIQLRTNIEAETSAAVNVYLITQADGDKNYSDVEEAKAGYGAHANTFLGTKSLSTLQGPLTLAESIGYVNLAAAKKDTYVSVAEYTGVLGNAGVVELTADTAYYLIIAPDANSTAINDKVSGSEATVTQEMYISGIKLIPAAAEGGAEEDDTEDNGNVGVHLSYVLNSTVMLDQTNYGNPRLDNGVLRPGGFADINDYSKMNVSKTDPWAYNILYNRHAGQLNTTYFYAAFSRADFGTDEQGYVAFKLKVPNKGKYSLSFVSTGNGYGMNGDVYLFPAGDITEVSRADIKANTPLASLSFAPDGVLDAGEIDIPKRGDYYLVIDATGGPEGQAYNTMYIEKILLDVAAGEFDAVAVSVDGIDTEGDPMPRGTTKKVNVALTDSLGVELKKLDAQKLTKLEISSSDTDVAEVDADGQLTAKKNGTAKIIAEVVYDGKTKTAEYNLTVADKGKNLLGEEYNTDFNSDKWIWLNWENQPTAPENAQFMRTYIGVEPKNGDANNRALAITFDKRVAAEKNPSPLYFKNDMRLPVDSGKLYQLSFKLKINLKTPEGATDMGMMFDIYDYTNFSSTSTVVSMPRSSNVTAQEGWRGEYADWVQYSTPVAAETISDRATMYLSPRLLFRPVADDLAKAGFEGTVWIDDIEICEVGYTDIELEVIGDTTVANSGPLDIRVKPKASTGTYISVDTECLPDAVEFSTTDKYVINEPGDASREQAYKGSGINYAAAKALLGGKNGEASLEAHMTLNGITRSAVKTVEASGFPIKLLYAEAECSPKEIAIDETATTVATGYLSDGSPADMSGGTIVYGTSTPDIISVSESGVITPIRGGVGVVTVTMQLDGELVSTTGEITITDTTPLAEATLPETATVGVFRDNKIALSGTMESGYPASFENAEIKWTIENCSEPGCISIGEDGTLYGHTFGATAEVYVTVTLNGATKTTNKCVITVVEADMRDVFIDFTNQKVAKVRDAKLDTDGWEIDVAKTTGVSASTVFRAYGFQATTAVNNNVTIKVNVPYEGIYALVVEGQYMPAGASDSEIYVDGNFAGNYSYYYSVGGDAKIAGGPAVRMRSFYLTAGVHELTFRAKKAGETTAYQQLSSIRLAAEPDYPEIKEIKTEKDEYEFIVGDKASLDATVEMKDGTSYAWQKTLAGAADPLSSIAFESADGNVVNVDANGNMTALTAGETMVTVTAAVSGKTLKKDIPIKVDGSSIDMALPDTDRRVFYVTEKIKLGVNATLASGARLPEDKMTVVWTSDNTSVVSFVGNEMAANAVGTANVKGTVTYYGGTMNVDFAVSVENDHFGVVEITAPTLLMRPYDEGIALTAAAKTFLGADVDMTDASVEWSIENPSVATIDEEGFVKPVSVGETKVYAVVTIGGASATGEAVITVREGKVSRTYYTDEMVEAARENVKKYAWAKSLRDTAIKNAEKYLGRTEFLYHMIPGEGIPRTSQVGLKGDNYYQFCRYCGVEIGKLNTAYPWISNPLSEPWKLQCPNCQRKFPSNDFESFYELGLNEQGIFDRDLALERHKELFDGKTYGYGYLKNDYYNELTVDPFWQSQGKEVPITHGWSIDYELAEANDVWGVDDGFGYDTGRSYAGGLREVHSYIGYYHQFALWNSRKHNPGAIQTAVETLRDAYLYTGDAKYGRIGAIMMDRIADVYPDMNARELFKSGKTKVNPNGWVYAGPNGGEARGKIIGSIWETYIINYATVSYDAFFPMYDDPQVIKFLTEKAIEYGYEDKLITDENGKVTATGEALRRNFENNYLLEAFKAVKESNCRGNFGAHQASLAYTAVVMDTAPYTNEMMDWLFNNGTMTVTSNTGGNISERLINQVSRDGQGNESAPGYNRIWVTELSAIADTLGRYNGYKGMDLYSNPKYLGMIKSYAPLTLVRRGLASIGDSGSYGNYSPLPDDSSVMINAFKYTKDPEIAQHFYMLMGGKFDGLHYDVFTKNPEDLGKDIEKVIEEYGEFDYDKSALLTGYGFGVLRGGALYESNTTGIIKDTQRDFWLYFGGSLSHSNNDDLNLGVEAYGLPMTSDLGYPEEANNTDRNRSQWQNATISHNTVVVNENSSSATAEPQKPLHFDAKDTRVKVMDVDSSGSYSSVDEYRRTIVMVDYDSDISYGIDFFKILGGNDHIYSFHPMSTETPKHSDNITFVTQPTGTYAGVDVEFGPDPNSVGENAGLSNTNVTTKYPKGYTWLFNIKKAEKPAVRDFWLDYKIEDRNKLSRNGKMDIHLRMTMLNDFEPDEITLANGMPPRKSPDTQHAEYMLVRRKGTNLNTLFTTVIEPYNKSRYIKAIENVPVTVVSGTADTYDSVKAVRVDLVDGRSDYIVYAQNKNVTYNVGGIFEFRGFVGVYGVGENGENIYTYINDGEKIGAVENLDAVIGGKVTDFTRELSLENYITIETDCEISDADILVDRMINVEHKGEGNSAFMIKSAELLDSNHVKLGLGYVTPIDRYVDYTDISLGYKYDVAEGASFEIPMSYEDNSAPVFDDISDNITASAGSSVTVRINATGVDGAAVEYRARVLPRGASFDSQSGVFSWKPDNSQLGENLVAIDAIDEFGRISTKYFTITVHGSTGGGSGSSGSTGSTGSTGTTTPTIPATPGADKKDETTTPSTPSTPTTPDVESDSNVRFIDLGNHAWAADAINSLADESIIKGTSENTFSPAANITRADFAILLVRAFELASESEENFADVQSSDYFAKELAIARNTGLVNGIGDNKFAPRNNITRQDMMVIVYRTLKSMDKLDVGDGVLDVPQASDFANVADYAKEAVSALVNAKLVNGKNGLIAPTDYTTRAEVAVLIRRILDFIK